MGAVESFEQEISFATTEYYENFWAGLLWILEYQDAALRALQPQRSGGNAQILSLCELFLGPCIKTKERNHVSDIYKLIRVALETDMTTRIDLKAESISEERAHWLYSYDCDSRIILSTVVTDIFNNEEEMCLTL